MNNLKNMLALYLANLWKQIIIIIIKVNYNYYKKNLPESFDAIFFKSFITLTILYVEDCQTTTR